MRHEPVLAADENDDVPFPSLGGVERQEIDSRSCGCVVEGSLCADPCEERAPIGASVGEEFIDSIRNSQSRQMHLGFRIDFGCRHGRLRIGVIEVDQACITGPCSKTGPARKFADFANATLEGVVGSGTLRANGDSRCFESCAYRRQLSIRAGKDSELTPRVIGSVETIEKLSNSEGFSLFVVEAVDLHTRTIGSSRTQFRCGGVEMLESDEPRANDLGCAAVVGVESNDFDSGKVRFEFEENRRIRSVETVDGLRRVSDESEIVSTRSPDFENGSLEGVHVLCLVDIEVPQAPCEDVSEACVSSRRLDDQ